MMVDTFTNLTPPHDTDAEQAVLGAVFLDNPSLAEAMQYLTADDFYYPAHKSLFNAMVQLNTDNQAIDAVTLSNYFKSENLLQSVGGYKYLAELATSTPTSANIKYYAKIVRDKAQSRRLIMAGQNIVKSGYNQKNDVDQTIDQAEHEVMDVSQKRDNKGFHPLADALGQTFRDAVQASKSTSSVTGMPMGYPAIDKITTGLHDGEFMIIAARPAMGKTTFALNVAQKVAHHTKGTVALFSLEMGAVSLASRMMCARGNINANHLRSGNLTDLEWQNVSITSTNMGADTNVQIDDTPGINVASIMARARRLAKESGNLNLIIVDYLQLVEGDNRENRQQEVSGVSRQLKKLAKELDVPVIALSQLSRKVEQREDKRPVLSDIRESGSIEQDADIVAFLYRKDYYQRDKDGAKQKVQQDDVASDTEFIIEKNRSGPRGTVHLMFVKKYNKFAPIVNTRPTNPMNAR